MPTPLENATQEAREYLSGDRDPEKILGTLRTLAPEEPYDFSGMTSNEALRKLEIEGRPCKGGKDLALNGEVFAESVGAFTLWGLLRLANVIQ